jgi:hypothetical protein
LQIAKEQHRAIFFRETLDSPVQYFLKLAEVGVVVTGSSGSPSRVVFSHSTAKSLRSQFQRQPQSHAIEPSAHRVMPANGACPPSQQEKGGLEDILGVVLILEYASANCQHHASVATNQCRERLLVTLRDEAVHKRAVGCGCERFLFRELTDVLQDNL